MDLVFEVLVFVGAVMSTLIASHYFLNWALLVREEYIKSRTKAILDVLGSSVWMTLPEIQRALMGQPEKIRMSDKRLMDFLDYLVAQGKIDQRAQVNATREKVLFLMKYKRKEQLR